jgi:hypothetical protein
LEDDTLTDCLTESITVESKQFEIRREAAEYLRTLLAPLPDDDVAQNAGLWTWLSLFYFDQVCPRKNGRRNVKKDYYYVFEPRNSRRFYRHLLFIGWHAVRVASPFDRLFLCNPVSSLDMVTEKVMERLYLTRIPCVFEVLDQLYWDEDHRRSRVGIADQQSVRPGDLTHRFPIRIRQLEKTYDLYSLSAEQLIELLGDEFQQVGRTAAKKRA